MKLSAKINPKNLFKSKKQRSVSRSQSSSFNSSITASSASPVSLHHKPNGVTTPTSVLHDSSGDLLQAFQLIDTDNDGRISRSELESLLLKITGSGSDPICESEISSMINEIDSDGDGYISLTEFGVIGSVFGQPLSEAELKGAFEFFDNDGDGMITAEELFQVFKAIGDGECTLEDCRRMIRNVDKNGDGFVCFEDFSLMMDMQQQQNNYTSSGKI